MEYSLHIKKRIQEIIDVEKLILTDDHLISRIVRSSELIVFAYQSGNKTLFCGNGGSAADAQHLAAELSGKFYLDRPPIHAEACHVNGSFTTAVSNDYGFEMVYARYIQAVGKEGDVLVAISTSGNSENIRKAILEARLIGMKCIVLTGLSGGKISEFADIVINIPSTDTPRIQEAHILVGHLICELVEKTLFS
ncbi:MAG: SIS domain-containing protein [Prolixibacteraceae bacterium]